MKDNNLRKFDLDNLEYQEDIPKYRRVLRTILSQIVAIFFIVIIAYIVGSYIFVTPEQRLLQEQNRQLMKEYNRQLEQYKQLEKAIEELKQRDKDIYRVIFEAEPPEETPITDLAKLDSMKMDDIVKWNREDLDKIYSSWYSKKKLYTQFLVYVKNNMGKIQHIPSIQPVPNRGLKFIVYGFGRKIDPVYKTPSFHKGIDFAAPGGTPVFATADGIVTEANRKIRGLGKHIKIDHENGFETLYAHLSEMKVHSGQKVKQGQVIGYVGNTGKALLPHLHYEVIYKGNNLNPVYFFFLELPPDQFEKILTESNNSGISLD